MKFPRSAGILLHPTSLPGPDGIGDLGPGALRFLDFLADAGLSLWQVLPLGPTGHGDSPYQCFSAFAGNPLLVHVASPGTNEGPVFDERVVEFERVIAHKRALLDATIAAFTPDDDYAAFIEASSDWLPDYALFMALKEAHDGTEWTAWEPGAARREESALRQWRERLHHRIEARQVEQYLFYAQFRALKVAATERGIRLMGDLPIYVAHDSADVWAHPTLFELNADGSLRVQAGVPPDYFSATGQLWGNPIYAWERLREQGYAWWIRRLKAAFDLFDLVRIDHFRGFESYWEVAGDAETAVNGRWAPGPGFALFEAIAAALGPLPIIAENLGVITPEVEALRERCGFPGMAVLQFAFGNDGQSREFQPHRLVRECAVYTGTHDNDTTLGWWTSVGPGNSTLEADAVRREREFAKRYLATDGREMHWTLIRAALASVADTVLIPMQDVLGLGSEARMNFPGRQSGNWRFRFTWNQLAPAAVDRLGDMVDVYER